METRWIEKIDRRAGKQTQIWMQANQKPEK